jgi:hypothetical protein
VCVSSDEFEDPEGLLQKFQNGEVDPGKKVGAYIDYVLKEEKFVHGHVRGLVFGNKKWFGLNGVRVNLDQIDLPTSTEISEHDKAPANHRLR